MARHTISLKQIPRRRQLELLSVAVMVFFALLTLLVGQTQQASLTYDNGNLTYTGGVKSHRMTGQGKLTYGNGDTYEGEFKNGVFDGQGTFTSSQGWVYTGQFKNGQPHGQGKLTTQDQRVYDGQFKQGIFQK